MWIILGIIGFLAVLITVILLLPVKIILKNDAQNALLLRFQFLFKTFGEDPDPKPQSNSDNPIVKLLKSATGADRLDRKAVEQSIQNAGLTKAVAETFSTLASLLKEVVNLLKVCKITKLHVKIRCAGTDAAEAAIHYGQCCAAAYTLLDVLGQFTKLRKRSCNIDIGCDFASDHSVFRYDVVLTIRIWRLLKALWKVVMQEAKRTGAQNQTK